MSADDRDIAMALRFVQRRLNSLELDESAARHDMVVVTGILERYLDARIDADELDYERPDRGWWESK